MRVIIASALLLAACSNQPADAELEGGTYAGSGRDRLCISGQAGAFKGGLVAYGAGNSNCTASGRLEQLGETWVLVPKGEGDCRIPLTISGDSATVGQPPTACSYYCGPSATMAGKTFKRADASSPAVDLAGDPLC